jgi:riboflavin kinase / FMN adenylyltransferase
MDIYRQLSEVPAAFGPSALTIGNFDGVHFGHRRILRRVHAVAAERRLKASVLTFHPHPTSVVAPERVPSLLTSPERRCDLMREEGIGQVLILPFTPQLARLSPEEFVRQLLVERLDARAVMVGDNFRFGYGQAGNAEVLAELGARYGFSTETIPAVKCRGRVVSSSVLRGLLRAGNVGLAARLLERPYGLEGEVVAGRGVGSKQTVPTLNLATASEVIPAAGVYVTRTHDVDHGRTWQSVTNIGYRPTFGEDGPLSIETFLLEPLAGATPRRIRVAFLRRLRGERRFDSPEALRAQILADARRAQAWFRRARRWVRPAPLPAESPSC